MPLAYTLQKLFVKHSAVFGDERNKWFNLIYPTS